MVIVCEPTAQYWSSLASWRCIRKAKTILKMMTAIVCCQKSKKATLLGSTNFDRSSTLLSRLRDLQKLASLRLSRNMASAAHRHTPALSQHYRIVNTSRWMLSDFCRQTSAALSSAFLRSTSPSMSTTTSPPTLKTNSISFRSARKTGYHCLRSFGNRSTHFARRRKRPLLESRLHKLESSEPTRKAVNR